MYVIQVLTTSWSECVMVRRMHVGAPWQCETTETVGSVSPTISPRSWHVKKDLRPFLSKGIRGIVDA